jgi:hypothetical protein
LDDDGLRNLDCLLHVPAALPCCEWVGLLTCP